MLTAMIIIFLQRNETEILEPHQEEKEKGGEVMITLQYRLRRMSVRLAFVILFLAGTSIDIGGLLHGLKPH